MKQSYKMVRFPWFVRLVNLYMVLSKQLMLGMNKFTISLSIVVSLVVRSSMIFIFTVKYGNTLIIVLYVDDLLFTRHSTSIINDINNNLRTLLS